MKQIVFFLVKHNFTQFPNILIFLKYIVWYTCQVANQRVTNPLWLQEQMYVGELRKPELVTQLGLPEQPKSTF